MIRTCESHPLPRTQHLMHLPGSKSQAFAGAGDLPNPSGVVGGFQDISIQFKDLKLGGLSQDIAGNHQNSFRFTCMAKVSAG